MDPIQVISEAQNVQKVLGVIISVQAVVIVTIAKLLWDQVTSKADLIRAAAKEKEDAVKIVQDQFIQAIKEAHDGK